MTPRTETRLRPRDGGPGAGMGLSSTFFPRGVRLWHFVVLPALGMGVALLFFHLIDRVAPRALGPAGLEFYPLVRTGSIVLLMVSLIAWLAQQNRRSYEAVLETRNRDLETTRDFLASIIEGSGEAIVTLDREGRVTSWNRSAERIYGWSAQEMLGQPVQRVFPPGEEYQREWEGNLEQLRAGRIIHDHETSRIRRDGTPIRVQITRSPLDDASGQLVGSTAIVRDVTALKEMEARLVERERLAAVGELAAQVAHEIKNPLAGIRGACEVLSWDKRDADPRGEMAREMIRQVDRLSHTVDDLLLFAQPKVLRPVPTDLPEVIDRTLGILLEDPRTRDIQVKRRFAPGLGRLLVDPQQFEHVLINVLVNAFQAVSYRGTVTVETRRNGKTVEVVVRDTGPGIPDEIRERIFQPFFTTRSQGSGLGLAIARNLVQAHGGTIDAAPVPGGGAQFTIRLPGPT